MILELSLTNKFMATLRHSYRAICESNTVNKPSIISLQKFFQIENGIPIHMKAGRRDGLVFSTLVAICGAGLIFTGYRMYQLALGRVKKK